MLIALYKLDLHIPQRDVYPHSCLLPATQVPSSPRTPHTLRWRCHQPWTGDPWLWRPSPSPQGHWKAAGFASSLRIYWSCWHCLPPLQWDSLGWENYRILGIHEFGINNNASEHQWCWICFCMTATHLWQGFHLSSHLHQSWKPAQICGGSTHHRKWWLHLGSATIKHIPL